MKKKFKDKDFPTYEVMIDDEDANTGFNLISIVKDPAIGVRAMAFRDETKPFKMEFAISQDKQILAGPALIPDLVIPRKDIHGEYNIIFRKEQILKMVEKFNSSGSNKKINFNHSNKMIDAYILQDFIIEDPVYNNARSYGFEDLPVGTYFIVCKVTDKSFWDTYVREEGFSAFSVEGFFGMKLIELRSHIDKYLDEILLSIDELDEIIKAN